MNWAALVLISPIMMIAPGGWVAFTAFDRGLGPTVRLALAIALSPAVLALQVLTLTTLGASFDLAAKLLLLNAGAFWLMRPSRQTMNAGPNLLALLACFALFVAALLAEWIFEPRLRIYSWHNFMQAAAVYQIARLPAPMEQWDLAGHGLHYSWLGHIQTTATAWLADASPFYAHPIGNIAALFSFLALLSAATMRLAPQRAIGAVVASVGAFLSTNLAGIAMHYAGVHDGIGETRLCTLFYKFFNFETMTSGMPLAAGALLMAVRAAQSPAQQRWLLGACVCAAAVAIVYPLLFPGALFVCAAAWSAPKLWRLIETRRLDFGRSDLIAVAALAASLAVLGIHLYLLGSEGGHATLKNKWVMAWAFGRGFKSAVAWTPLLALAAWRLWREKDVARTALMMAALAAAALFVSIELPTLAEYKFMFAALLALMPIVADEALRLLSQWGRAGLTAGVAFLALIVAFIAPHFVRDHAPWFGVLTAPAVNESHFAVEAATPDLAWTTFVRDRTPSNAILIAPASRMPLSVFTQRPMYAPVDMTTEPFRYGYLMSVRVSSEVQGLPADVVAARTATVRSLFDGSADISMAMAELEALHRPLVFAGSPQAPVMRWLREHRSGRSIYEDSAVAVWLETEPPHAN
jgi:hypothetical protein